MQWLQMTVIQSTNLHRNLYKMFRQKVAITYISLDFQDHIWQYEYAQCPPSFVMEVASVLSFHLTRMM